MKRKRSLETIIAAVVVAVSLFLFVVLLSNPPSGSDSSGDSADGEQSGYERKYTYLVLLLPAVAIGGGVYLLYSRQGRR